MTRKETIKWLKSLKTEIGKSEHRTLWHYAKSIDMAIKALSAEDTISRSDAIETVRNVARDLIQDNCMPLGCVTDFTDALSALPSAETEPKITEEVREALMRLTMCAREECDMCKYKDECGFDFQYKISTENMHTILDALSAVQGWIPCSERLPEDLEAVNVTWVNHNPPVYYQYTKDVPNADTAVYYRGVWYWWDSTICDVLGEYGEECGAEPIDKYIEVTAWMPLPKPYKGGDDE